MKYCNDVISLKINVGQKRRDNQDWTINPERYWVHEEDKKKNNNNNKNTTHNTICFSKMILFVKLTKVI